MDLIVSLLLTLLVAYVVYMCFEKFGFVQALMATIVINLIRLFVGSGNDTTLITILFLAIKSFFSTAINYWLYQKTATFYTYFIFSILAGILLSFLIGLIKGILVVGTVAGIMSLFLI